MRSLMRALRIFVQLFKSKLWYVFMLIISVLKVSPSRPGEKNFWASGSPSYAGIWHPPFSLGVRGAAKKAAAVTLLASARGEKNWTQRPRGKEITPSAVPYLRAGRKSRGNHAGILELRGIEGREGETERKYVAHAGSVSSLCACGELQPTHPRALSTCVDCFDFVPSTCLWRAALISRCPHGPRARISGGLLGLPPRCPESALFFTCAQLEPGFLSVRLFLSSQRPKVSCALCPVPCCCLSTSFLSWCFVL